jgi:hypothetical protein
MSMNRARRLACAVVLASAATVVAAQPASAQEPLDLPAGVACTFAVRLTGGAFPPERRTFTDKNGNSITLLAGKSGAVTYTNLVNQKSITFNARGTRFETTARPDGTARLEFSGHIGIILFPTDVPAGPSTTQISGRVVVENAAPDGDGVVVSTVVQQVGQQIDVCAAIS